METGEILKYLRLESDLTQKELAEKLGIGQSTIVGYELGEREAIATNLIKYADFFNVSIDFLLGRTDELGAIVSTVPQSSDEDREVLSLFHTLTPEYQAVALNTLRSWASVPAKGVSKKKA